MSRAWAVAKPWRPALGVLLATCLASVAAAALQQGRVRAPSHFADAEDAATVRRGRDIYGQHCASCHGRRLQGQPLWQLDDEYAGRRAPAHDATGHTWRHGDDALFAMTRNGRWAGGPPTSMPAFAAVLDGHDIEAALAFIKAGWPIGLRVLQAMQNPGQAGLPAGADGVDWTLPPTCMGAVQRAAQSAVATQGVLSLTSRR